MQATLNWKNDMNQEKDGEKKEKTEKISRQTRYCCKLLKHQIWGYKCIFKIRHIILANAQEKIMALNCVVKYANSLIKYHVALLAPDLP